MRKLPPAMWDEPGLSSRNPPRYSTQPPEEQEAHESSRRETRRGHDKKASAVLVSRGLSRRAHTARLELYEFKAI